MNRCAKGFSVGVLLLALSLQGALPPPAQVAAWLQPDRVQQATLAPDGRHLAYTVHEDERTAVILVSVDDPSSKTALPVGRDAVLRDSKDREKTPIRVPFLRWVGPNRLVYSTEVPGLQESDLRRTKEPTQVSVIYAVDADGRNLTKLGDGDSFGLSTVEGESLPRQPRVLDLAPDEPDSILVEAARPALGSNSNDPALYGRVAIGLFQINARTGQRRVLHEHDVNGGLLYDRQGNARIELWRPIDRAWQSFISLPSPGRPASKQVDKMLGDVLTPENYLGRRTFPVGFDYNPDILYLASNEGRDTYGLYAFDLRAGKRTGLAVEHPGFDLVGFDASGSDSALVFDRSRRQLAGVRINGLEAATKWLDPELAGLQAALERKFPGRNVRIVEWDEARSRFLVLTSGPADPGRYYVYHRGDDRLVQFVRRHSAVDPEAVGLTTAFAFDTPAGVHLTGYVTLPRSSIVNPPPLLVYCHGGPWQRDEPGFNRDAQVLAAMGFVVLQVNYRGSAGFGASFREALRADIDGAPLADIQAAIAWVAGQHKIDRKRVALLGEGFGGYLALRALQVYPDEFRCAVAINAPTDLEQWTKKPEGWQEKVDRQAETSSDLKRMQKFLLNFGPPRTGPLAQSGPPAPSFAEQGLGDLTDLPTANGEAALAGDPGADAAGTVGAATAGGQGGPPPPPFPPTVVNFSSEVRRWYFGRDFAHLAAISPARHADLLTKPVLLIQDPFDATGESGMSAALRSALSHTNNPAEYLDTTDAFARRLPGARARVYKKVEEFFSENLYNFDVKIGIPRVQK